MAIDISARITTLTTRLAKVDARLDEMLDCPRPSYNVDGQKFDWTQYQEMLLKMRREIVEELDDLSDANDGIGFEIGQIVPE